jgi:tRNA(Ile2) C34 agmatinyltransferase TiaS
MAELSECPECGGPLIDAGPTDIRCVNCGATYEELVEILGDEDIELTDEFPGGMREAHELGYHYIEGESGLDVGDFDW